MDSNFNVTGVNKILNEIDAKERIKFVYLLSPNILLLTSGGKKYSVIPNLFRDSLPVAKIPVLFVDIGCYDFGTYHAINNLIIKGYDMRIYHPLLSSKMDEALYGENLSEKRCENDGAYKDYQLWCRRRKEEPFIRALNEFKPDFVAGGRTKFQSEKRKNLECIEKREDIFQFNPIFDWTDEKIKNYILENNLPENPNHFDPTKEFNEGECPIWYNI